MLQWFYSRTLQDKRIITKTEGDFGREIGPDMQLFLPMFDATIHLAALNNLSGCAMLT
jgi:hypothetical protein